MRVVFNAVVISLAVSLCFFSHSGAEAASRIESMKLLTPDTGWVATTKNLFWTTDAGRHWKQITPKMSPGQSTDSVFFLDTSIGWALLIGGNAAAIEPQFELASTNNAGTTWSILRIKIPHLNPENTVLTGGGHIDFVDPLHGWMNIPVESSANFQSAILLVTIDGGRTWDWVPESPGVSGSIRFIDLKNGWLAGGPNQFLYATHDGSKSWQELSLKAPPDLGKATNPLYDLPTFEDEKNGFLPVTYSGPEGSGLFLVLFSTHDGGDNWKLDRVLPHLPEAYGGVPFPSTVVDSVLLTAFGTGGGRPRLTAEIAGGKIKTVGTGIPGGTNVERLTFAGTDRGWVLSEGKLLLTADGGETWTNITPAGN